MPQDTRPVVCFVDDDRVEIRLFKKVFGKELKVVAGTDLSKVLKLLKTQRILPRLFLLDLYYPKGGLCDGQQRVHMMELKRRVDLAQKDLSSYLDDINQGIEYGLEMLHLVRKAYPRVATAFYTRKGTLDVVIRCKDEGVDEVIAKPHPEMIDPSGDIVSQLEQTTRQHKWVMMRQFERLMGTSKANVKNKNAFVIMPFREPFNSYYVDVFTRAIRAAGLRPVRADEIDKQGAIVNQIWQGINESRVCIAEVTTRNPNVMYELGLAHAVSKPVVQIAQEEDDLPFDLRHHRFILYKPRGPRWKERLIDNIRRQLIAAVNDPSSVFPPRDE
jgi:CheY-like chemotaxis protein